VLKQRLLLRIDTALRITAALLRSIQQLFHLYPLLRFHLQSHAFTVPLFGYINYLTKRPQLISIQSPAPIIYPILHNRLLTMPKTTIIIVISVRFNFKPNYRASPIWWSECQDVDTLSDLGKMIFQPRRTCG